MLTKNKITSLIATVSLGVLSLAVAAPRKAAKERTKLIKSSKETTIDNQDEWFI